MELNPAPPVRCGLDVVKVQDRRGDEREHFRQNLFFPIRTFSVCSGRVILFLFPPHPTPNRGVPRPFLQPCTDEFLLCSGDSLCHNNFWRPASRQDGHASGSGPSKCMQVREVLHGASSLPSGSLRVSDQRCPLRASPPHRFMVDFQCGCSLHPRPDIAIHFNPRFHTTKPHVICNTLYRGRWQAEARWPHVALQRGASFLILFLFGNEEMKVSGRGHQGFPGGARGKEPGCQWRRCKRRSLDQEDALKDMTTHSSTLAWRILWTEEPGGLQFIGSQRVGHD